jgi:outer membrane receptor for ferrienterochelin and colicins
VHRWIPLALLLICSPAFADEGGAAPSDDDDSAPAGDDDDSAPEGEQGDVEHLPAVEETLVVTATGEGRLLSDVPVPVRVVDEEAIRRSTAGDAADLLRRAPGIPVMSHGVDQRGGVAGISLQGVPAGRTLILIDGRPVSGDVGGVVDLSQFPADFLERIEIVEGPMSALYGSDALGGVVNLISRRPPPGSRISGRIQAASDKAVDGGLTLSSSQADGLHWGATVTARIAEGIDLDPSGEATNLDDRKSLGLRLIAGLRRPKDRIELTGSWSHDAREGVFVRHNAAIQHDAVYDGRKRHDRIDGSASWVHDFDEHARVRVEIDGTDYGFGLEEDLRDSPVTSVRRARTGAFAGRFRLDLHSVSEASAMAGVEGRWETLRVHQDRVEPGGLERRLEEVAPTHEWSIEPWTQADLRLFSDRLEIIGGVRLSIHDAYGVAPAPSLAIRVNLWRDATLRVSGGRGYRAPSLKDRYLIFDHSALGYVVYGDPDLRPESSWGANLSLEQRFSDVATLRIGGYANRLTDLITYVFDGAASTDGLNVYRSTNIAGARTVGAQVTGDLRLPFLVTTVAYRFLWAWSDDGFFLPDSPIHGLRATVEVILAKIELSLYNGVSWESERFVDDAQQLRSPGLVRWDARLEKRFSGRHDLAIFVGVDNILNQRRDPNAEGDFRPVDGRRVLLGVRGNLAFEREERP